MHSSLSFWFIDTEVSAIRAKIEALFKADFNIQKEGGMVGSKVLIPSTDTEVFFYLQESGIAFTDVISACQLELRFVTSLKDNVVMAQRYLDVIKRVILPGLLRDKEGVASFDIDLSRQVGRNNVTVPNHFLYSTTEIKDFSEALEKIESVEEIIAGVLDD